MHGERNDSRRCFLTLNKLVLSWAVLLVGATASLADDKTPTIGSLTFTARTRVETEKGSGLFLAVPQAIDWKPAETAVVICDMWDTHWCQGASSRVVEMAPRMNDVITALRNRGVLVIHCPSATLDFYKDSPGRKLAQAAPKVPAPVSLKPWCRLDPDREGQLPIDDSDGGCDCQVPCAHGNPWKRQIDKIAIADQDAITDSDEAWHLMRQRGIKNVIVMGVHTNMCVLGRPFSIRQMVYQGQNVLLVRDMTDTMYNSRMRPFVSHCSGTDLVVEHIEKFWCPTITSVDIIGGKEFRFAEDTRPHLAIVMAEDEYDTRHTLPKFAATHLNQNFRVSLVFGSDQDRNDLTGIDVLKSADVALLSIRRRTPRQAHLDVVRQFVAAGKPVIALRTTSHAFAALGNAAIPAGHAAWPQFDREVLGCNYTGHHGNKAKDDPVTSIRVLESAGEHPILTGIRRDEFPVRSWLYKSLPLAATATPLMMGRVADRQPHEPVAWTNLTAHGGRVFYTMMGHADDFETPEFQRLLLNGVHWAAGIPVPKVALAARSAEDYAKAWTPMPVPGTWDQHSRGALSEFDGIAWYRCLVKTPPGWKGQPLELFVEQVDNAHEVYWNGTKIGGAGSFPPDYKSGLHSADRTKIPLDTYSPDNVQVLAIRVFDHDGRGGFKGLAPVLYNERSVIELAGEWQFRTGDDLAWAKWSDKAAGGPTFAKVQLAAEIAPRITNAPQQVGGLSAAESFKAMQVNGGLVLDQVLAEPVVRQPLSMSFDERGRLWVVQYLQYPTPAGLKMVSRDNYWRAVYDRVPPAPPNHFRGLDKITIHEDTDGDGTFDKHKTFVDGLNITTAAARGRGGVWVLNPPYLLFYADANNDDVPDGDPVVHLEGFGIEDTHSVTNSLRFGPDGWLYATQGSTVTGAIRRPGLDKTPTSTMGQLVWRYHPETKRFEIFAEGGGNAFGVELDAHGRIFSGHNGGDTRGFHYVQGGYLQKGFNKHGPLSNPYAFGYFPAMAHHAVPRFTHTFLIYESGKLGDDHQGHLFGVEPLQGQIVEAEISPDGSTFKTKDLTRVVTSKDSWFRPVDIKEGPDGAIYVADWYDGQVNHYRNNEGKVDPSTGRIYRLRRPDAAPAKPLNMAALSGPELVAELHSTSRWRRQTALRLLGDRRDSSLVPQLKEMVEKNIGQIALEALWATNLSGGWSDTFALAMLRHADPYVRLWTVRLLGDQNEVSGAVAIELAALGARETNVEVRSQLASTAKRIPAVAALPIVRALLAHQEDAGDPHMPLLTWWAIESKCDKDRDAVLSMFSDKELWKQPLVEQFVLERLVKRFAMSGARSDLLTCAKLLAAAPDAQHGGQLLKGFEAAYQGRSLANLPEELVVAIAKAGGGSTLLQVRQGNSGAIDQALKTLADEKAVEAERIQFAQVFGEVREPRCIPVLLEVLKAAQQPALRQAALGALSAYDAPEIAAQLIALDAKLPADVRAVAEGVLASRLAWSKQFLAAVDGGTIDPTTVSLATVRKLLLHKNDEIATTVKKHWGEVKGASTAEIQAEIDRLGHLLRNGHGSPYRGKQVFLQNCGKCHVLFSDGGKIGPDLTTYKRDDLDSMLLNVVNPSAQIREGFENFVVQTDDGRQLNGFLIDQDSQVVVLRGADGQTTVVPRADIEELRPAGVSLMPEQVLKPLSDDQVRDLFAYLRSTQPLAE